MEGHILRRNCLLKHVTEGNTEEKTEETERRRRRRTQLLYDLKGNTGYRELNEEALTARFTGVIDLL